MTATPSNSLPDASSSLDEAICFLNSLDISAMKLGLDRIRAFLDTLGNPQDTLPMVHIAGTNGKGSVTAMLASVLQAAGYRTGRFISPHLVDVRERIALNGLPISKADFEAEINAFRQHLDTLGWPREDWPTYFECLNILAYRFFQRMKADVTVFETGLGGRLDSTNVVKKPCVTVITTIGLDHMKHLGNTLAEIAAEKAGILKSGVPVVLGGGIPPEARAVILQRAQELGCPVIEADAKRLIVDSEASTPESGLWLRDAKTGNHYHLALAAPYQRDNLAVVQACVACLREQGFNISGQAMADGLAQVNWPARFQYFDEERLIVDGSHNADGFASLQAGLKLYFPDRPLIWLVSLRSNRPLDGLLSLMAQFPHTLEIIATAACPEHLYYPPAMLGEAVRASLPSTINIQAAETPVQGLKLLQTALSRHVAQNPLGLVTGSLYTAGSILEALHLAAASR